MTTYTVNGTTYTTLTDALKHASPDTEITCSYNGASLWTDTTDEHGALWLTASQCRTLDTADLIALINAQPECDEVSISELLTRGGLDPDAYDDIGLMYEDAIVYARSLGYTLGQGDPTEAHRLWYAVMRDGEDTDWGTGSRYKGEALAMARKLRDADTPDAYIAVIDDGDTPVCIDEIHYIY